MIVADTHAWVWFLSNPEKLSKKARSVFQQAKSKSAIYISSISVWEFAQLLKKERMKLNTSPSAWLKNAESLPYCSFVPVNNSIALRSVNLSDSFHKDPADRIIVSTAIELDLPIVSKDKKILNSNLVEGIW